MRMQEYDVRVLNVRNETSEVRTTVFEKPAGFTFLPGQFLMLDLGDDSRPFSISCSPTRNSLEVSKKIGESGFSQKLAHLKEGDTCRIRGPFGMFTLDEKHDAILLAGGIGVTPFRSFIEYATDKHLQNKITLFYSNRTPAEIPFRNELESVQNPNMKIFNTITRESAGWHGLVGRIDEPMIRNHAKVDNAIFYICGPPAMVDAMQQIVAGMNVPKERIRIERFFGY